MPGGDVTRCQLSRRVRVWSLVASAVIVPLAFGFFDDERCSLQHKVDSELYRKEGLSPRGYLLGTDKHARVPLARALKLCVAAVSMGIVADSQGRYRADLPLHRWTWRFVVFNALYTAGIVASLSLVAVCPGDAASVGNWHFVFQFSSFLCYISSGFLLMYMMRLKLDLIEADPRRANASLYVIILGSGVFVVVYIVEVHFTTLTAFLDLVGLSIVLVVALAYIAFYSIAVRAFLRAAWAAEAEADGVPANTRNNYLAAARWTRFSGWLTALAASTTAIYVISFALKHLSAVARWLFAVAQVLDFCSNIACALTLGGFVGPRVDTGARLSAVGDLVRARRERHIHEELVAAAGLQTVSAATIAALMGSKSPQALIFNAKGRFRCISFDDLAEQPHIFCQGRTSDGAACSSYLYALSKPCQLAGCDAFVSHSWSDNAELKWKALRDWCQAFRTAHGRSPLLWLDKVCIHQANLDADLECLPIFLAGCNHLLALCGETYPSRLWCVLELFVYLAMHEVSEEEQVSATFIPLVKSSAEYDQCHRKWQLFDAAQCESFDPADKTKILAVMQSGGGSIATFNEGVRKLFRDSLPSGSMIS